MDKQDTPTEFFKTEQISTVINPDADNKRGTLIIMHQCGDDKDALVSQLNTMINGIKNGFDCFLAPSK